MKCRAVCAALALLVLLGACSRSTGALSPALLTELKGEGIRHRQDDLWVRYTHGTGAGGGWEEHRVSIVVTGARILIHRNDQVILEVTSSSGGRYSVRREGDRVSLRSGDGRTARSWAFHPVDDPDAWAKDMRAVIKKTAGGAGETSLLSPPFSTGATASALTTL
jgi:hypothetical protein